MIMMMVMYSLPSKKTLVSSVNNIAKSNLAELAKSFICTINRGGPKIELCGHHIQFAGCWNYNHYKKQIVSET